MNYSFNLSNDFKNHLLETIELNYKVIHELKYISIFFRIRLKSNRDQNQPPFKIHSNKIKQFKFKNRLPIEGKG